MYPGVDIHFEAFDRADCAGDRGYFVGNLTRLADILAGVGLLEGGIAVVLTVFWTGFVEDHCL